MSVSIDPATITVAQAAQRIGVSRWTLYRLINAKQFPPAMRIGKRWRVSVVLLDRYLRNEL